MSHSDSLTPKNVAADHSTADIEAATNADVLNTISDLEKRIPKDLTANKRAIVDKLVAIYKSEAR